MSYTPRRLVNKNCSICGATIYNVESKTKYCKTCGVEHFREVGRERYIKKNIFHLKVSVCPICTKVFNQYKLSRNSRRTCCSNECAKEALKRPRPSRQKTIIEKRLRKNATEKLRKERDPQFHLSHNMKSALQKALVNGKMGRKWELLVGYTSEDLKQHLEKKFKKGMSWDNYGEWHIDHIIPKSVFHYTDPTHIDFKRCWALSNLQPLWGKDNISKHDKLKRKFQPSLRIAV